MKQFKFFKSNDDTFDFPRPRRMSGRTIVQDLINTRPIDPVISGCLMEGYRAHRDNIPPGQCPYNIGTLEREYWMTGWSSRENREPRPYVRV